MKKAKVYVKCILCGKEIEVKEAMEKWRFVRIILNRDYEGIVEVGGWICDECCNKIVLNKTTEDCP